MFVHLTGPLLRTVLIQWLQLVKVNVKEMFLFIMLSAPFLYPPILYGFGKLEPIQHTWQEIVLTVNNYN